MQLRGTTITFNGINSSRYGLYLCNVDGGTNYHTRQFGSNRSLNTENGAIKSIDHSIPRIDIQLVKLGKNSKPMPLTEDNLDEISRWLFSPQEYKPLIVDQTSKVYYGMFVSGEIWQNEYDKGYLTLQFELNADHAYTVLQNSDFRVNGTRDITINSKHTYELYNEVDMEIKLADGQNSFTVINRTTGQTMELKNLPSGCNHIYIYNDGVKHVQDVNNKSRNLRPNFNKVFIHLAYGTNQITLKGVGTVRFISQGKVLLN